MRVVWEGAEWSHRESTEEDKWLSLLERLSTPQIQARPLLGSVNTAESHSAQVLV